jgi:type I restriction enzyme S subunit
MSNPLPENWTRSEVRELFSVVRGVTYKKEDAKNSHGDDLVPILRANNINIELNFEDLVYVPSQNVSEIQRIRSGDIVIAMSSGSKRLVGKAAIAREDFDGGFGAFCGILRPSKGLNNEFLGLYFQSENYRSQVSNLAGGTGINNLKWEHLYSLEIPIPPSQEQQRILSVLEPALAKIDDAEEALERVRCNLDRYRASVLKAACEGRLVPTEVELARQENRDYEPASELLKRILIARREAWEKAQLEAYAKKDKTPPKDWKSRYQEPQAPDISDLPELPEGWCWSTLDQLCSRITSGSRDWTQYYGAGPGVFVMAQNVRMGRFDLSSIQLVNPPNDNRDRDRSLIRKNDLLLTIVGAKTGDVCRVDVDLDEHYVCQSVALVRPVLGTLSRYLEGYLCSQGGGQAHFRKFTYGQGRPHLGFDQLQAMTIPLPPSMDQDRIVEETEQIISKVAIIQKTAVAELQRCHTLRQSLLKHAFSGKLVPQDSADEPASVLLERIRAQRLELKGGTTPRKRVVRKTKKTS